MSLELLQALTNAYESPDDQAIVNKAHRVILAHQFILPVKKILQQDQEPEALFYTEKNQHFLPIFSSEDSFKSWAGDSLAEMDSLNIIGKDIILGTGANTYLCLDVGQPHYKEFEPKEIIRLKQVVLKIEKIAKASSSTVN